MEISNPSLNLCVELIGLRAHLEHFCRKHGALLSDKVVIYKHMEHWDISSHGLHTDEAPVAEYIEPEIVPDDDPER